MDRGRQSNCLRTMRFFFRPRWLDLLRFTLAGVFMFAGSAKFLRPLDFADSLETFRLFPVQMINLIAITLPPLEIVLGLLLLVGWRVRTAAFGASLLSIGFCLALGQAAFRGIQIDCGCFGSADPWSQTTLSSLVRALFLFLGSALLYWRSCALDNIRGPSTSEA